MTACTRLPAMWQPPTWSWRRAGTGLNHPVRHRRHGREAAAALGLLALQVGDAVPDPLEGELEPQLQDAEPVAVRGQIPGSPVLRHPARR
ncbi:hypothetical protein EAO77_29125 [Streptomyces sp. t39]|nr:hypothetical protein EAO77_29125 [Streptomyces sp. t39]